MDVKELQKYTKVNLDLIFDYRKTLARLGYKQEDIDIVRDKIIEDCVIPKYVTNGQVCLS